MNPNNKIRSSVILVVILGLMTRVAFATSQQPDVLISKGKSYDLFANPLEDFYKRKRTRPLFRVKPNVMSTGNWRGYVATWTIENGSLYLLKIDAWICRSWDEKSCRKVRLKSLFGGRYIQGRVRADWFSGDLRMPDGELLQYVHMGYGSVYERELTVSIESGKVVKESIVDNAQRKLPSSVELERQELEKMKPNGARSSVSHFVYGARCYESVERTGLGCLEPTAREGSDQRSEEQGQIRNVERRRRERVSQAILEVFCKR